MKTRYGLVLQKSIKEHKIEGKECYGKRKRGQFKDSLIHFPEDTVKKQTFNKFVENEGYKEIKYDIE